MTLDVWRLVFFKEEWLITINTPLISIKRILYEKLDRLQLQLWLPHCRICKGMHSSPVSSEPSSLISYGQTAFAQDEYPQYSSALVTAHLPGPSNPSNRVSITSNYGGTLCEFGSTQVQLGFSRFVRTKPLDFLTNGLGVSHEGL